MHSQMEFMKRGSRKQQIVAKTLEIIGNEGLAGLTIAKIAAATGVTEAALYRHFKSKEEILSSCIDLIRGNLIGVIQKIRAEETTPLNQLKRIFMIHIEHIQTNRGVPRIIYTAEVHSHPGFRKRLFDIIENYIAEINDIIREGQKSGEIKSDIDSQIEARHFISMIQFTAFRLSLSAFDKHVIEEALDLWRACLQRIGSENVAAAT